MLDFKAMIPLHFLPKMRSQGSLAKGKWHHGLVRDGKNYIGKVLKVLVFHKTIAYLESDH